MLILTRKPKQTIHVGDDVTVTVVSLVNGRVKLGFDAPPEVKILRGELEVLGDDEKPKPRRAA